jgi:dTDP-4-amino-4,6-dideoxygalactose transaminase
LQLSQLAERVERRQAVVAAYKDALTPIGFTMQEGVERSAPAFVPAAVQSASVRDRLVAELDQAGVECRTYYNPPVHAQQYFAGSSTVGSLQVTDDLAARIISFPISDVLTKETVSAIASLVRDILGKA